MTRFVFTGFVVVGMLWQPVVLNAQAASPEAAVRLVEDLYRGHPGPRSPLREAARGTWPQWFAPGALATLQRPDWVIDPLFLTDHPAPAGLVFTRLPDAGPDTVLVAVGFTQAGKAHSVVVSIARAPGGWLIANIVDALDGRSLLRDLLSTGEVSGPPLAVPDFESALEDPLEP